MNLDKSLPAGLSQRRLRCSALGSFRVPGGGGSLVQSRGAGGGGEVQAQACPICQSLEKDPDPTEGLGFLEQTSNRGTEMLSDLQKVTQLLVAGRYWGHRQWKTRGRAWREAAAFRSNPSLICQRADLDLGGGCEDTALRTRAGDPTNRAGGQPWDAVCLQRGLF